MLTDVNSFLDAFDILEEGRDVRQPFEDLVPQVVQQPNADPLDKPLDFWEDDPDDPWWSPHEVQDIETLSKPDELRNQAAERVEQRTGEPTMAKVGPALADKLVADASLQPSRWMKKYENGRIPQNALVPVRGLHYSGQGVHYFRADAAQALQAMARAAKKDGQNILLTDSYRSYAAQVEAKRNKGSMAATPGTSNHGWGVAGDFATARDWIRDNGHRFGWHRPSWASDTYEPWHFEFRGWDGATVNADQQETSRRRDQRQKPKRRKPKDVAKEAIKADIAMGGNFLSRGETDLTGALAMPMAFSALEKDIQRKIDEKRKGGPNKIGDGVWGQLKQGFIDAGRPDLARFVSSKDFKLWVRAESGGNARNVSIPNNNGMVNGGLFQFWAGHDWAQKYFKKGLTSSFDQGNRFQMSIHDQAVAAVRHFGLTVAEIKRYADQIRADTYVGWG